METRQQEQEQFINSAFGRIFMLKRSIFFSQYINRMPTPNHQLDLALIKLKNGKIKMSETTSLSMLIRA
ncbi:hypothetical protein SynMVIR181_01687 [Synechococcus sp. MVIR-18-1]|nr:hypothetical protein SynMVIR181_01687 [Synechococcus sp. MVIR-18-1]